jgi:hypothetical protein
MRFNFHIYDLENEAAKKTAEKIIRAEISAVMKNPLKIKQNGCAACHVLFSIMNKMRVSEQDAADLLENSILKSC